MTDLSICHTVYKRVLYIVIISQENHLSSSCDKEFYNFTLFHILVPSSVVFRYYSLYFYILIYLPFNFLVYYFTLLSFSLQKEKNV